MNNIPVAGIDVSKNFSDICILSPDNTVFRTVKIYHDCVSMERSLSFLKEAETEFNSKPVIIMEATGHYHRLLFQFLHERGYEVIVINPIQSGALRNINIRKIKTDKVDAHRIALFYRLNTAKISTVPSDKILCLRSLCRQHFDLKQDMISHANRLNSYLDQYFPGLAKLIDVLSKTALSVLSQYPTPQSVLDISEAELFELISASSRKGVRFSKTKATLFKTAAKEAVDMV